MFSFLSFQKLNLQISEQKCTICISVWTEHTHLKKRETTKDFVHKRQDGVSHNIRLKHPVAKLNGKVWKLYS